MRTTNCIKCLNHTNCKTCKSPFLLDSSKKYCCEDTNCKLCKNDGKSCHECDKSWFIKNDGSEK